MFLDINFIYRYDNNIYAFLLLGILLFVILAKKDIFDYSRKLFLTMIVFNMVILIVEVLAWVFDGVVSDFAHFSNYLFNCLLIIMEPMMAALWLSYVDYKIFDSRERIRKRLYYMHASIFAAILIIINFFTPVAFSIDASNVYHRGDWLWLSLLFVFCLVLYTIVLAIQKRKELRDKMIIFITIFAFLPVLVSLIQLYVYGLILTWAVVALGIVSAYYLIEISGNSEDYLTGLFSRRKMEEILTGKVEKKEPFSVIMIDLEYFKEINDKYGHKAGDTALIQFAKVLQIAFSDSFYLTRIGGDEFLIVSKRPIENDINEYKDKLRRVIEASGYHYLHEIGVSFGAKTYTFSEPLTVDMILDEVDLLMYADKSKNKSTNRTRS